MVGRYLLLRSLGRGGGGEVLSAFDPVLDRKVAIKFLHGTDRGTDRSREALVTEGRLLAKVVHPAVVQIYEVGFHDDRAFMAMELVEGDFEAFAQDRRATGEFGPLLAALRTVAEGIIAAHAAGVIHGDIKPSNVLGGSPTQLKVSDFGIARLLANESRDAEHPAGTPAFMAPEQLASGHTDERSDQYSYCLMAWTVLCGANPFDLPTNPNARTSNSGDTATGKVLRESPPVWPKPRGVPGYVANALRRGLDLDPERRWPSMAALLVALRPNLARQRLRNAALLGAALAAGWGGLQAYRSYALSQDIAHCEATGNTISASWNESVATAMHQAMRRTGATYAQTTAEKVAARLDDWSARWQADRTEVCTKATISGEWSASTHARAQWCLTRRRLKFDAAVIELQRSDPATLPKAIALASSLPRTTQCTDLGALLGRPTPPSGQAQAQFSALLAEISRASALEQIGRYDEGLAASRSASELASAMDDPQATALTQILEGMLLAETGAYSEAESKLVAGYLGAASERDWIAATRAAERLILVVGLRLDRMSEGAQWHEHALLTSRLAGDPAGVHAVSRAANLAVVKRRSGEYDEALALHEIADELADDALGAAHPSTSTRLNSLASLHLTMGKTDEAIALFERVLAMRRESLGPEHPDTVSALGNLAAAWSEIGKLAKARQTFESVLLLQQQMLGPEHPSVANTLGNLAAVLTRQGEFEEAQRRLDDVLAIALKHGPETHNVAFTLVRLAAVYSARGETARSIETQQRALAIYKKVYGPTHKLVGSVLINLGGEHFIADDLDAAEANYTEALRIFEETLGLQHANTGAALNNLADVAATRGDYKKAIPLYEHAYEVWGKALGPNHPSVATVMGHLGVARIEVGQRVEGIELLQGAITAWDAAEGVTENDALARMSLAEALVATPDGYAQAMALAGRAREIVVKLGGAHTISVAEIDAWLAEHTAD